MKTIETEIKIEAPASTVWKILMDFEVYPEWNPFIKEISGSPEVGQNLKTTIFNGEKDYNFTPLVLKSNPDQELRWKGKLWMKGIFDGEHFFVLQESVNSKGEMVTLFKHGEHFSGILSGLIFKQIGDSTQQGFTKMNEALKLRSENIFRKEGSN